MYEDAYRAFGDSYSCINAATMSLVAGEPATSERLANDVLRMSDVALDDADYWTLVTVAEAQLLLRNAEGAVDLLARADTLSTGEYATRATTRRQLELICRQLHIDPSVLAPLDNPRVVHFAGHRIAPEGAPGRFTAAEADRVHKEIRALLDERTVGAGFGSLASGADILIAESLLERGAELHAVLPFSVDEFIEVSVADSGPEWVERFHRVLDQATTVRFASDGEYLGDPVMFDFCSAVAMGEAVNRAVLLDADIEMIAVWDGVPAGEDERAGTAVDVARWKALGLPVNVIATGMGVTVSGSNDLAAADVAPAGRLVRAMLFADIAGFSTLSDAQMPMFMDHVMGPLAECIDRLGDQVLLRNTWGDGLFIVFADTEVAAECALDMQRVLQDVDLVAMGLPTLRGMRIGAHVGPVFQGWDRVRKDLTFFGANVTRAARIEPRTPEGEVYVTHPFAALIALTRSSELTCEYVGRLPAAKDYGVLPMYVLKHRTT
jgi:class 3 adenylate cyclase